MRAAGLQGVVCGQRVRTTRPDDTAAPSADLVQRQFSAAQPNQLWVADFTYVATWRGFVYVAFVIDVFSRRIVGWRAHTTMRTRRDQLDSPRCEQSGPSRRGGRAA